MVLDPDLVDWSDPDLAAHIAADGARMVPQPQLEALLAEHVARLGVPVRRGVEVTALDDTGDGVLVGTTAGPVRGKVSAGRQPAPPGWTPADGFAVRESRAAARADLSRLASREPRGSHGNDHWYRGRGAVHGAPTDRIRRRSRRR